MAAICKVDLLMSGNPPAVEFATHPEHLVDFIIEAIVETPMAGADDHGEYFFGSGAGDGDWVIDLCDPEKWSISPTSIASHACLSLASSGIAFVSAYLVDVKYKRRSVCMIAALDSADVLHVELLASAKADQTIFSASCSEADEQSSHFARNERFAD